MLEAFYEPDRDGRFVATAYTRGPWDQAMQHGGPPAALIARGLIETEPVEGQQLARVTFEILRPVPVGPVRRMVAVTRAGKKVSMVSAVLTDDDGAELILARAWRLQATPEDLAETDPEPPPPPRDGARSATWFADDAIGFQRGVEVRFTHGDFIDQGPAAAWFRMEIPLIAGSAHEPSDLLFVTADCGNGISSTIDFSRFLFINTDLSVQIERMPDQEWVCLDAVTAIAPGGITHATGRISDLKGRVARTAQTLYVGSR